VQWVFLGCPGVGKGTYASRLSRLLAVPHIATGDLVRDELASTGPLAAQVRTPLSPTPFPRPILLNPDRVRFADLDLV
jgi:adenylate kinase